MTEIKRNYYEILEIPENSSKEEIKKAYRDLAKKWHPDKYKQNLGKHPAKSEEDAKKKMQEIGEAYEKLNDEGVRKFEYNSNYYDYEVPKEGALIKETLKDLDESYYVLRKFYVGESGTVVNDYDLERVKRLLELLNTVSETNKEGREFESRYGNQHKSARFKYIQNLQDEAFSSGKGHLFGWFSAGGHASWEGYVKQIKNMLNNCRKAMGLSELTDSDLNFKPIKGNNNQGGEKPKIPGTEKPQQIEGGKFDEYNKLYSGGTHEVHVKFDELYHKVVDQFYSKDGKGKAWNQAGYDNLAKFPSFKEAYEKINEASGGGNRFISNDADASQEAEIKQHNEERINKKREAIKLIEKLLEEQKQGGNDNKSVGKVQNGNASDSKSGKRKAEVEIGVLEESNKRSRTVTGELDRLISEAQNLNTFAELEAKIKEIDKYQEEAVYHGQYQSAIKKLKENLAQLDEGKYREKIVLAIQDKFSDGVSENDLDEELKNDLAKIKNGEIEEVDKINEIEGKITAQVSEKKAENSLNRWLEKARKLVEGITRDSVENLKNQIREIQKNLYSFQKGTNFYQNQVYKRKEDDVKTMLSKLDNYSVSEHAIQPKSGFWQAKYVVPTVLVGVGLIVLIGIAIGKSKKAKVVKEE